MVKIKHTIINGKKWIVGFERLTIQCAYCLYVQRIKAIRDKDGLIIELEYLLDLEEHAADCKQNDDK